MSWAQNEVVQALTFLAPGLVGLVFFYSLTALPKPSETDRIVHGLVFTLISQAIVEYLNVDENNLLIYSLTISAILGIALAIVVNKDYFHWLFRLLNVTTESSQPSVWWTAFATKKDCYVVLHLTGQRRIFGWPQEWPSMAGRGYFRIEEAQWLDVESEEEGTQIDALLVAASDVEMVEFIPGHTLNED